MEIRRKTKIASACTVNVIALKHYHRGKAMFRGKMLRRHLGYGVLSPFQNTMGFYQSVGEEGYSAEGYRTRIALDDGFELAHLSSDTQPVPWKLFTQRPLAEWRDS